LFCIKKLWLQQHVGRLSTERHSVSRNQAQAAISQSTFQLNDISFLWKIQHGRATSREDPRDAQMLYPKAQQSGTETFVQLEVMLMKKHDK
jgi:hypothetical protein